MRVITHLFAISILSLGLAPCLGQTASLPSSGDGRSSTWNHNGSSLALFAAGSRRQFKYDQPRAGMREVGVRPGTLLFDGVVAGKQYSGTAYVFSKTCGALPYSVSGPISSDWRSVTMYGRAPQVDSSCNVAAYRDDELVFNLAAANTPTPTQAPPPITIATPTQRSDDVLRQENAALRQQLGTSESRRGVAEQEATYARERARAYDALVQNNAALRQQLGDSERRRRLAEQDAISADERTRATEASYSVRLAEHRSSATDGLHIQKNTVAAGLLGALGSAFVVMFISTVNELIRMLLSKRAAQERSPTPSERRTAFLREVIIQSLAAMLATGALYQLGYVDEWKLVSLPLAGGLSVALLLAFKHKVEDSRALQSATEFDRSAFA